MKKILFLFLALKFAMIAPAQMEPGSIAPDWTATDIDGVEWNLYTLLDQGYRVVLDFSATWCGPCWSYHNSGALEDLYDEYGPEGTNELMVFFMEGDDATTSADLNGTGGSTWGDWTAGTPYPIIDNVQDIFFDYDCTYYPTIYTICPDRKVTETGQAGTLNHYQFMQQNACSPATENNDPSIVSYNGMTTTCGFVEVLANLENFGLENLTACTIELSGVAEPLIYNWTGNLETFDTEVVNLGTVEMLMDATLQLSITSANDVEGNDEMEAEISFVEGGTTHIHIDFQTDNYPGEIDWYLMNDAGEVIQSVSYTAAQDEEEFTYDFELPLGCYTFRLSDGYGDGMTEGDSGYCIVMALDDDGNEEQEMFNYDGTFGYDELNAAIPVEVAEGIDENFAVQVSNVYPNPVTDILNYDFTLVQSNKIQIEITDIVGAGVLFHELGSLHAGERSGSMDVSAFAPGVYMFSIISGTQTTSKRIVVQ